MSEAAIVYALRESGPLTGYELLEKVDSEPLELWRQCATNSRLISKVVGRRFLRLDRAVPGYARLSPSIRREFLTYTLLSISSMKTALEERAAQLGAEIQRISEAKRRLARQTVASVVDGLPERETVLSQACFVLAGDITYGMAHRVPRPEQSTGELVHGSDLDLVIVTADSLDPAVRQSLDDAIYQKKHFLLVSPSYREEIDYLLKDLSTVTRQVAFDTFEHMVACKILVEGELLYGSPGIHQSVQGLLAGRQIPAKLAALEKEAIRNRADAERTLQQPNGERSGSRFLNLFYTSDENDEIY